MRHFSNGYLTALLLFTAVFPLFARDVEILVEDTEINFPLEGAVISGDGKQYVCGADGRAFITAPDNRQIVIQAAYPGYDNGRLVIMPGIGKYTLGLKLSSIMEGRELVIEAAKPGTSETKTGRSVAVSGMEMYQTAEIGLVEDVVSSIKLLPGVGYTGFFNAQPSIRGGDPRDMRASLDGYYIFHPYHWGGGFSIFDPRIVESAQLSHGVFTGRYGNTISGLLDITSKKPNPHEPEFELGVNTAAANFSLSLPLFGKGGVLFIGRVTYYEPIVWLAKAVVNGAGLEDLDMINAVKTAPFIRSGTFTGNYRFLENLELKTTGFFGVDGVGVSYEDSLRTDELNSDSKMNFDWINYQGFITAGLAWNPGNDMLLKFTAGTGYVEAVVEAKALDAIHEKSFVKTSANDWYYDYLKNGSTKMTDTYSLDTEQYMKEMDKLFNIQGRIDYDWELGNGFLFSAGVQEIFMKTTIVFDQRMPIEFSMNELDSITRNEILLDMDVNDPYLQELLKTNMRVALPARLDEERSNRMFLTSPYGIIEYNSPGRRFSSELGLRIDHFYLTSQSGASLQSKPILNPRLNIDFNVFKNRSFINSFDLSIGTGLFSSINEQGAVVAENNANLTRYIPDRSWTSVLGAGIATSTGYNFSIEGYHKYIFDRTYIPINVYANEIDLTPHFNGVGRAWGIDFMLQKMQSRFWDGWVSYSYNWTRFRDPDSGNTEFGLSGGEKGNNEWYYPYYHRFHNLNMVLNIKPTPRFSIYTRFGIASGVPLEKLSGSGPLSYPVYMYDPSNPAGNKLIEKYYWPSVRDENNRTTPSFPMDIKFSFHGKNNNGKICHELYFAIENVLAMINAKGNNPYNPYTGEIETGNLSDSYEMPVPIPSFGFKVSY